MIVAAHGKEYGHFKYIENYYPFRQWCSLSINCCHWAHPWMGKAGGNAKQCQPWRVMVFKEALLSLAMHFVQTNPYGLLWAGYCFTRCRVQRGSDGIFPVRKHIIKVEAWRLKAKFYLLTPSSNLNLSGSLWESSKMLSFSPGGKKCTYTSLFFKRILWGEKKFRIKQIIPPVVHLLKKFK